MNIRTFICLAVAGAAASTAAIAGPVNVELKQGAIYLPDTRAFWRNLTLGNGLNHYAITALVNKASGEKPPSASIEIANASGTFGFSIPTKALDLTVNGIALNKLNFKSEDFSQWSDGENKGVEIKLNFDGAKLILRLYMRPDSGVLWGKLYTAPDTLEPVTKASAVFSSIPSCIAKENGKVKFTGSYQRTAKTPANTYTQSAEHIPFKPEDTSFVIHDTIYDGSTPEKGFGPTVFWSDNSAVQKGKIRMHNAWTTDLLIDLNPGFKEYDFGIYNQPVRTSNADFLAKFEAEKSAFTLQK